MVDPPPTVDEFIGVDLEMIKLINKHYKWKAPPYMSRETTNALLLEAGAS